MTLGEMYIDTSVSEVPSGTTITFNVTNAGTMDHDFRVNGKTGTDMIAPGGDGELRLWTGGCIHRCMVHGSRTQGSRNGDDHLHRGRVRRKCHESPAGRRFR